MIKREVQLSKQFKIQATKSILAIVFFAFTYILILLLATALTVLCVIGGFALMLLKPTFITIAGGVGLACFGLLILAFLLKFMFKSHKVDRSHLIEITERDEPQLFNMIHEIIEEVGTTFPKKVYLSSEVNASVFYDSNFWSMFFPIKKNLQIGLGLINTVTKEELKAILSHEFGHFSQRTMKIGSYVYNVNQVIFNILYEKEPYSDLVERLRSISEIISLFIYLAAKINDGIQWILKKLYVIVNKSYLGLSREMEFHADEIAASVTGYQPLKKSLLRLALADHSYNIVLNFYNAKIAENKISENIYKDQLAVIDLLADLNKLPIVNGLPDISTEEQSKYNKSKLVIKDQWASHPSIEERINRLEKTGYLTKPSSDVLANELLNDCEPLQKRITKKLFESVQYSAETTTVEHETFFEEYKNETLENSFSKEYNGYYDNKNPLVFDLNSIESTSQTIDVLFSDEKVDLVYSAVALQNDIELLNSISNNLVPIKTFDYDGVRLKSKKAKNLIQELKPKLEILNKKILENDIEIYKYFCQVEELQNKPKELKHLYSIFFENEKNADLQFELYNSLLVDLQFTSETTPIEAIKANFYNIIKKEERLKLEINKLLNDAVLKNEITEETKALFEKYTNTTLTYFGEKSYYNHNLEILFQSIHTFGFLLSRKFFLLKRNLLKYQEDLLANGYK